MTERSYDTGYWQPPTPYYEGGEASPTTITVGVPIAGDYNCSIDGRRFRLDRLIKDYEEGGTTIPLLRNQIDASADPGEASINREELWRRSRITWYMGAGQQYADRSDNTSASNDARFWTSKGIDPWTRWQLTLLADTTKIKDLSGTNSMLVPLGTRLYLLDGTNIYSTTDTVIWSTVTGGTAPTAWGNDGYDLWITDNGNIRRTTTGAGSSSAYLAATTGQSFYNVGWVRGRLVAADRQFLYEITAPSGIPISGSALNDAFGNVNWRWTAITESVSKIYVAGYSGLVSQIFWIQPIGNDPSAALGPPVPAGPPMPTGEVINTMIGYLGFLVIGTSKGIRVATEDQAGNLTVGAVTEIPGGVTALWGNDRFVWFSWTNFDDSSTGLGRIDLSVFPPENVSAPAYASDLMATTQGRVTSVAAFGGKTLFCVAGDGVYAETSDRVDAGTIDVGRITYGMIDPKVATRADIRQTSTGGSVSVTLSGDEGMTEELGTQVFGGSVNPTVSFDALEIAASVFSYKVTLYPAAGDATDSPVIRQIQLRVWPAPNRGYTFSLPLVLSETNERHPSDDYDFLTSKVNEKHTVLVQVGEKIRNVVMEDYSWMPVNQTSDGRWQNGTLVAKCKVMAV